MYNGHVYVCLNIYVHTAIDFVNKTTAVVSDGLLIDSTPPQTTGQQISGLGDYVTNSKFEAW